MAILLAGNGGVVADVEGATFRALKGVSRPLDHGTLGHYRIATTVGLVASQTAAGTLFSWRWTHATNLAVLLKLRLTLMQTAAATATLPNRYQVFVARSFTVSDSSGTAITLTGNSMKKRTNMGTTLVGDIRRSTAVGGLSPGTRTLDADPLMELAAITTITNINTAIYEKELEIDMAHGPHPYVFAQNEGLIVRGPTTVFGAAGTADLLVDMSWAEVTAFG